MTDKRLSLVTFQTEGLWLAVAIERVHEINRMHEFTSVPHVNPAIRGVINLRGHIVTLLDLARLLTGNPTAPNGGGINVVLSSAGEMIGLVADAAGDVEECTQSEIEPIPGHVDVIEAAFLSGVLQRRGEIIALLDVDTLLAVDALQPHEVAA